MRMPAYSFGTLSPPLRRAGSRQCESGRHRRQQTTARDSSRRTDRRAVQASAGRDRIGRRPIGLRLMLDHGPHRRPWRSRSSSTVSTFDSNDRHDCSPRIVRRAGLDAPSTHGCIVGARRPVGKACAATHRVASKAPIRAPAPTSWWSGIAGRARAFVQPCSR
jgi:hypothetical protein